MKQRPLHVFLVNGLFCCNSAEIRERERERGDKKDGNERQLGRTGDKEGRDRNKKTWWNRVERNVLEEVMWTKGRYNRKEENKRI